MRALVLALVLTASPPSGFIPEPLLRPLPGIRLPAHDACIEWWTDWAAQHHGDMKRLTDVERHCAFVNYLRACGLDLEPYEMPGSPPGHGASSFDDVNTWDDATAKLYGEHCFEFDPASDIAVVGRPIGETPRVVRVISDQEEHVKRRLVPLRRLHRVATPGLVRPASKIERHRALAK